MGINIYVLISFACIAIVLAAVIKVRRASSRVSRMIDVLEFVYFQLNEVFRCLNENEESLKKIVTSDRNFNFFDVCELVTYTGIGRIESEISVDQTKKSRHSIIAKVRAIHDSLTPESAEYVKQLHDNTSKRFPPLMFLILVDLLLEIVGKEDVRLLTPSINLTSDLGLDSLDFLEIAMGLEGLAWITIKDDEIIRDMGEVFSFGDLVLLADKKYMEFKKNECE